MPRDRSPWSSRPFLPYPSYASRSPSPLRQAHTPHSSFTALPTSNIQPSQNGPYPPSPRHSIENISRIPINGLPHAHAVPQQPSAIRGVCISSPPFADRGFNTEIWSPLPPSPPSSSSPSPSPSPSNFSRNRATTGIDSLPSGYPVNTSAVNEVPHVSYRPHLNEPQSSALNPGLQFLPSKPQHSEEPDFVHPLLQYNSSVFPLATQPHTNTFIPPVYSAQSELVNQHYAVGVQPQSAYPTLLSAVQYPQAGPISHPRIQSTPRFVIPQQMPSINQRPPPPQNISNGMFYQAHDFVIKDSVFIDNSSDNFMASFLKETIIGAEFDSSDPNMPLRCHPGTRLEIIKRCQEFVLTCHGPQKLRWVVGAAGVGKSAIMQSVAQDEFGVLSDIIMGATIFFSINGRQDGTKAIITIAYQLAVKLDSYRLFIQREVTRNPSLLRKSLSTQFKKFIVEPFVHHHLLHSSSRLLIIIDGLDECANRLTQQELLGLISFFSITYPSSPLIWMVASRPEPHIVSFFSQPKVALSYEKEEIVVDSDDAHEDVKRYLRDKFREVRMASVTLRHLSHWPSDGDFSKVAEASCGLFAYASTVVRYISDPTFGDPVGQLDDVLGIIKAGPKSQVSGQDHPMVRLDALYAHIMSTIPAKVMANTRNVLLLYVGETGWTNDSFRFGCNMLGMTVNTAYGATHHIRSIAIVPQPSDAENNGIEFFHKSFPDYLRDDKRSGFSHDIESEAEQLAGQCGLRIIKEAPDGVYMDGAKDDDLNFGIGGVFRNGPGTGDNIFVSWPAVGDRDNREIRFKMFRRAVCDVMAGLKRRERAFQSLLCIRVLTSSFARLPHAFPVDVLRDLVFDKSRRREFLEHGILKGASVETLDYDRIAKHACIQLRFRSRKIGTTNSYDIPCKHEREGKTDDHDQDWSTKFVRPGGRGPLVACNHCFQRLTCHLNAPLPGCLVTVLDLTPTYRVVELRFVDLEDGGTEWIYVFEYGARWSSRG